MLTVPVNVNFVTLLFYVVLRFVNCFIRMYDDDNKRFHLT